MILNRPIPSYSDLHRLRRSHARQALAISLLSWAGGLITGALVLALIQGLT